MSRNAVLNFETEHYKVEKLPLRQVGGPWVQYACIIRKDSGEVIKRVKARGATSGETETRLTQVIQETLSTLNPPEDWGRDPAIPALIKRYLACGEEMVELHSRISEQYPREEAAQVWELEKVKLQTQQERLLSQAVAALSDEQKFALVSLTPEQKAVRPWWGDAWTFDDLTAKKHLGSLIMHPSPRVKAARDELIVYLGGTPEGVASILETDYYRAERDSPEPRGEFWFQHARIIRKDSNEVVEHLTAEGATILETEARLRELMKRTLSTLGPPADWGRDPAIPALVKKYLEDRDLLRELNETVRSQSAEVRKRVDTVVGADYKRKLSEAVAALTEKQQLELVTPTPEQRAGYPGDPRVADELIAKERLGSLIVNPSPKVKAARDELSAMLKCPPGSESGTGAIFWIAAGFEG